MQTSFISKQQRTGVLDKQRSNLHTHTHTAVHVPGHWGREVGGETKRETDEIDFLLLYLPKRWRISPPVHPDRAWAVSRACCGPWNPGAGPCSLRSPWFLFRAASRTLSAASSSLLHYLIMRPRKEDKTGESIPSFLVFRSVAPHGATFRIDSRSLVQH